MDNINYLNVAKAFKAKKSFGQNFLISEAIAEMEANYAKGLNVIELGPGFGILTRALCKTAKKVVAIEKDDNLFEILKTEIKSKKLNLVNADFFSIDDKELKNIDIMISNIPYNLSSKVIYWLSSKKIPAIICIQKEFADHVLASPNTKSYSKLSVICALSFSVHLVKTVSKGNFYPIPKVESSIIYLIPKKISIDEKSIEIITQLMNHKKKKLRNAIIDSSSGFGIEKEKAKIICDQFKSSNSRPFQMPPHELLEVAMQLKKLLE